MTLIKPPPRGSQGVPGAPGGTIDVDSFVPGLAVGDCAYIDSSGAADKACATDPAKIPAIGIVAAIDAPNPGQCQITTDGVVTSVAGPLVPSKEYVVSTVPGRLVNQEDTGNPDYPQGGDFLQKVGLGLTATQFFVRPDQTAIELSDD